MATRIGASEIEKTEQPALEPGIVGSGTHLL